MPLVLLNRQSEVRLRVRLLRRRLEWAAAHLPHHPPAHFDRLSFVLVDRATMARVHGEFLGDATETDVITFPYGEILVCPAVAGDSAAERNLDREDEVLLYCLHGLLHLAGYDDRNPAQARAMAAAQETLLRRVLRAVRG